MRKPWVKLPSAWINEGGLQNFRWVGKAGSNADNTTALMTLIALAHHADHQSGVGFITYDLLEILIGRSRAKLARGLAILEERSIIEREGGGRSYYGLLRFDPVRDWAKLPCKSLYHGDRMAFFDDFTLRKPAELNALKLYLLFAARRGDDTNMANISYDKITEYSGIAREHIKAGLSVLAINNLAHVERVPSTKNEFGISNAYRLTGIEPHIHMGTRGRGMDAALFGS